ncbi:hypothetical protein DRN73_02410 [Candidatus Pacearchaeota archaeon]|nr:MAG: hypothetical protein DRN73_02410 [Candidatus Pacearchaeota archaeon]
MKFKILFTLFLFIIFSNFIFAQTCNNVGFVNGTHYCDIDGTYKILKQNGDNCSNNFECFNQSCIDELCQLKYVNVSLNLSNQGLIDEIWNVIQGIECNPQNQSYHCEGTEAFLCGANAVWESKGHIDGVCGYSEPSPSHGGGSSKRINIILYSPLDNITYDNVQLDLNVSDSKKVAKFWYFSLNQGRKVTFVPNTTLFVQQGKNNLTVYAKKFLGDREVTKKISFNVVLPSPVGKGYCGDNICQNNESCENCIADCGECPVLESLEKKCGNNICDDSESSFTCPVDCIALERKDYTPIAIGAAASFVVVLGFVIYKSFFAKTAVEILSSEQ